jgi:hypothetical protein
MRESLCLFSDVINNRWFIKTPVILFMNKKDLFVEKIKRVNLNVCFKGYRGKQRDYDEAIGYIAKRFIDLIATSRRRPIDRPSTLTRPAPPTPTTRASSSTPSTRSSSQGSYVTTALADRVRACI